MSIAVIGAGAMGSIYGGHLSRKHTVYLIDSNKELTEAINRDGLEIEEEGRVNRYYPKAFSDAFGLEPADLVILFVKALYSRAALESNRNLIGENTYILTLQNGAGHEELLSEFVPEAQIIIGTTEDNGKILGLGKVRRGGRGRTNIGALKRESEGMAFLLKEVLDECGFDTVIHENIQALIWEKLFVNVSLSAVTGLLGCPMGFVGENPYAWSMAKRLAKEALQVAGALGLVFEEDRILKKIKDTALESPEGITSICADLKAGRRTEVDTISGAVVRAAQKCGRSVPVHEFLVAQVHGMEERG